GVVLILKDLDTDLTDRHVLIVEDIIDSGLTLSWLVQNLRTRGAATVEICTMLRKPEAVKVDIDVKYVGFDVPNEFVIGYGLDYAEKYRNVPSSRPWPSTSTAEDRRRIRRRRTEHRPEACDGIDPGAFGLCRCEVLGCGGCPQAASVA